MKKKVFWIVLALLVVVTLVSVNVKKQKTRATVVETEAVEKRELTEIVSATGRIQPKISVDISSDVTGKIVEVAVNEGDRVEEGDLLIRVDPTQFRESVRSAEAQYESARAAYQETEARLEQMKLEWKRIQSLYKSGDLSERDFEQNRMAFRVSETQRESAWRRVDQAKAFLEQQRDKLAKSEIRAPMSGIVIRRNAEVGEVAQESLFSIQVLMVVADLSVMEVEIEVDETEVPRLRLGQTALIEIDAFPDQDFRGKVTEIANSPILGQQGSGGVDFRVDVTLDSGYKGLRSGLSATAEVTTAKRDSCLSIPIQSLVLRTKKSLEENSGKNDRRLQAAGLEPPVFEFEEDKKELEGVFLIRNDRAIFRPVLTGIAGDRHFELIEGLEAEDRIVTGSMKTLRNLHHGEKVKETRVEDEESGKGKKKRGFSIQIG
ncbi:MAG: efflux RND transporter periplasmic adaptor subunit [Candidatus Krumholzibacteria bacterium]|jgi:HlyD family secretion protein|nr:efflux RND transporter periplasmic adaptor subunit [Candidatus Krumholzibacteria bacterium]MDP6669069.1 efflux RND transporter periplasmic adaptor subunit [Candidatus Krumholzibacteria bacterium]MDP6797183.1 efflux RND transporter periplasmic adaptor subunit [Candidatus Krumholzibacteria bacterium]MDP7021472.1 efflux RND transporter periplasmic adaptor subunit [Candidatus Krumholzibacteria bacterium]